MLMHSEITAIMAKKFKEEQCCFTEKDIKVRLINSHIEIQIRDYDHITFQIIPAKIDNDFAVYTYECTVFVKSPHGKQLVDYNESSVDYPFKDALVWLAYHIANTF